MTAEKLYEKLDKAGIKFEVVEIFEGVRILRCMVEDDEIETWSRLGSKTTRKEK
jgi:hypothetical protein